MKKKYLACAAVLLLTACGGGSNNALPVTNPSTQPSTAPSSGGNTTFAVDIPQTTTSSAVKRAFVSPSTRSITIALQSNVLGTLDTSAQSSACTVKGSNRHCTISVNAPSGNDTFTLTAYDQAGGTGNVLAKGNVTQTVTGQPVTVSISLGGITNSLRLVLAPSAPPAGTAATVQVVLQALDADGHVIVGPYDRTITLADADTTGITSLSATKVTDSSQTVTLSYNGSPFISTQISASATGLANSVYSFAPLPAFVNHFYIDGITTPDGSYGSVPGAEFIAKGPDGNFWVTATTASAIMKVTPSGNVTTYWLPNPAAGSRAPQGIVAGKDGALWFTESYGNNIGRITTDGQITEYPIPTANAQPIGIAAGSDGNLWFAENQASKIAKIDMQGNITEYPLASFALPNDLTMGPDGNLWVDESGTGVELINLSGQHVATYPLEQNVDPYGVTVGGDGNMWIGDFFNGKILRVTPSGTTTVYAPSSPTSAPDAIAAGPDGRIWFAESGGANPSGAIGYVDPKTGHITEMQTGSPEHVRDLMFTNDGMLWFAAFITAGPSEVGEVAY